MKNYLIAILTILCFSVSVGAISAHTTEFLKSNNECECTTLFQKFHAPNSANEIVYIYTWGIVDVEKTQDECALRYQKKYGFAYKSKGSCMMDDIAKMQEFNRHNREVRAILADRHGDDWQERYEEDVEFCRAK